MKKVVIPVVYVLIHFILSIVAFFATIFTFGYTAIDLSKIAVITSIVCTVMAVIFGFRYGEELRVRKPDAMVLSYTNLVISAVIISVLFAVSTLLKFNIFGKWLTFKNLFSYSVFGLLWDRIGLDVNMKLVIFYVLYYIIIFHLSTLVAMKIKLKR